MLAEAPPPRALSPRERAESDEEQGRRAFAPRTAPFATRRLKACSSRPGTYIEWPGPNTDRRDFKALCRQGLPPHHRGSCWERLSGAGTDSESHESLYHNMLTAVFSDELEGGGDESHDCTRHDYSYADGLAGIDRGMRYVPHFGGAVAAPDVLWQHRERLGDGKVVAAQRLLHVMARTLFGARSRSCTSGGEADGSEAGGTWDGSAGSQGGGDATYCPFLPDLVCILLRHLPEPSVYAVVCSVLERSRNDPDAWFPLCRRDTQALAMAVGALCAKRFPKTGAHLADLDATGARAYVARAEGPAVPFELWFERFFVGWVPDESVLRLVDTFLCEGNKAWAYYALGLLKTHKHEMKLRKDIAAVWRYVKASQNSLSPDSLSSESFGLTNLSRRGILRLVRSFREELATSSAMRRPINASLPTGWVGEQWDKACGQREAHAREGALPHDAATHKAEEKHAGSSLGEEEGASSATTEGKD